MSKSKQTNPQQPLLGNLNPTMAVLTTGTELFPTHPLLCEPGIF